MCGIFSYKGDKQNAGQIVVQGLKRLDYRGYDSWGVGVASNGVLTVKKQVGKIGDVENLYFPSSNAAIAHTRWATTGAVTRINAHPHWSSDKSFILAQNGIVENFDSLKKELLKKQYKFVSETDTEVIVRLIEDELRIQPDFTNAIRSAFVKLEGRNTIILLCKTGEIYAARNGSPLVVGLNTKTKEIFLSSDALSFALKADKMIVLDNNQLVSINNKKEINVFNIKTGKRNEYKLEKISINAGKIDKEGFDHFMIKEIYDTPYAIKQIINQDAKQITDFSKAVKSAKHVYVIGSGTAGFAGAQIAFYFRVFGKVNAISVVGADARSYYHLFQKDDLIIAPSQSGETADVIEVLEFAKEKEMRIASIVNMPGSMITRMSDFPFMSHAGPEICVMSTKIFSSQISWGYLISKAIQGRFEEGKKNLATLATTIHSYLENKDNHAGLKKLAKKLSTKQNIFLLGKYQNFSIINEGMVKIIEGSYKHAHALPAGDLKHYAITLMEKGVPVIVAVSNDIVKNDIDTAINEVRLRGAEVIAVGSQNQDNYDWFIPLEDTKETDGISHIVPLQLLAYYMAVESGNNVDKPRNIAKSVTVK